MFIYKSKFIKSLIAKTFLIAITIILIINNNNRNNYVVAQELMYSDNNNNNNDNENEEMTTSNLHFNFNNENNSGEMSDLIQKLYQLKNYNNQDDIIKQQQQQQQEQQQKHKQWNNEFDEITNTSHNDTNNNNNRFPSSIISSTSTSSSSSVSSEEKYYKEEDFLLTTMVPLSDFIQMFSTTQSPTSLSTSLSSSSSSSSSMNLSIIDNVKNFNSDEDNDYIKVNESRSSTLIESIQTPASYLMRKNIYIPQMKNINIDNDLTSSVNNLSIVTTNDTLDIISNNSNNTNSISYMNSNSNNNNNNNDSINVTDTISSFSSPIASPYISTLSGEDYFNENQMLGMKTISKDNINDEDDNNNNGTIDNEDIQNHEDEIFNLNINSETNNNNDTSPFNVYIRHQHHKQIYQNNYDINFSEMNENDNIDNDMNNSDIIDLEEIDNFDDTTTLSSLPITIIPMSFMPPQTITTATATAAAAVAVTASSTSALTTTTTTTSTTTMTTLRTKQGKQIHINKLLPHEALRNFIEDAYIRPPLAILVDTSFNSLEKAKVLWKDALRSNAAALDIVLLAFNASGVSVTYQFQNTRTLLAGLDNIKESTTGGNAFFAIIRACELIPYDSAIFISTASIPADINLAQYAAITLLKKRIRLYLIWFGDNTFSENETQEVTGGILGEVAIRSGGEILHIGNDTKFEDDNILTLSDNNYQGNQEFEIPTETTMSNYHGKVDTLMRTAATMVTPNGDYEIIDDDIIDDNIDDDDLQTLNLIDRSERKFKNFENIENPTVVITHENIRFPENVEQIHDNESDENKENKNNNDDDDDDDDTINIETTVKITNNEIEKLAKQFIFPNQGITKIDLSSQSQLLVTPGMIAQIYFEVTNTRSEAVFYNIRVTDEKGYLLSLNPRSISLPPGQTITVTLSVIIPSGTPQGTKDKITFICQGYGQASQSVELKVTSASEIQDATAPTLTWIFGARCDGQFNSGSCSQRIWNLEIIAQDWETGILRVESTPHGIIPRIPFVVGTTEQVRLSYTATCCQPRVTINAYDLAGNQRTSTIDVRDIVLNEASIAAIVLGILLLIALIILIIITIIWCCRKHKRSQDLPSFRSHPERTR